MVGVFTGGKVLLNPGWRSWLITSEEATSYASGTQIHAHTSALGEQPLRPDPLLLGAVLILSPAWGLQAG